MSFYLKLFFYIIINNTVYLCTYKLIIMFYRNVRLIYSLLNKRTRIIMWMSSFSLNRFFFSHTGSIAMAEFCTFKHLFPSKHSEDYTPGSYDVHKRPAIQSNINKMHYNFFWVVVWRFELIHTTPRLSLDSAIVVVYNKKKTQNIWYKYLICYCYILDYGVDIIFWKKVKINIFYCIHCFYYFNFVLVNTPERQW